MQEPDLLIDRSLWRRLAAEYTPHSRLPTYNDRSVAAGGRTAMTKNILERIADGRTDLVFDYLAQGHPAKSSDRGGTPLIHWCAYYGDVSGMRFLLANGEALESLGPNLALHGAAFHGHWELCQFLIEN